MVKAGKLRYYGVSVEKVDEALKAIEYPERPKRANYLQLFPPTSSRRFFRCKRSEKHVGILARVPLASGLLTGKFHPRFDF